MFCTRVQNTHQQRGFDVITRRARATLGAALVLSTIAIGTAIGTGAGAGAAGWHDDPLHGAKNLPPAGKVDFILGQDGGTLRTFKTEVLDDDWRHPRPSGVSLFASLSGSTPLAGMWSAVDFQVGRTQFEEVLSEYGGALTIGVELIDYQDLGSERRNLASWAIAGDPRATADEIQRYRGWVDELIEYAKATRREVFLKIGYEFDGHWNNYEPDSYKAAFRYIARRIDDLDARKVATVWQSASWGAEIPTKAIGQTEWYEAARAQADGQIVDFYDSWYPGDDAVDWMGISRFAAEDATSVGMPWGCAPATGPDSLVTQPRMMQDAMLDYARNHAKPVMIAESAPQGYDLSNDDFGGNPTVSCVFAAGTPKPWETTAEVTVDDVWDDWFAPTFDYVRENRDVIRSITYINTNWQTQGVWDCVDGHCPAGYWGDTRLEANSEILARVKHEIRDWRVWTRGPRWTRAFEAPDFSEGRGVYEAEYAEADTWLDCCGLGGLPEAGAGAAIARGASNDRHVMIMNFGDGGTGTYGIDFERVRRGSGITVSLASLGDDFGAGPTNATFSVFVNGELVGTQPVPAAGPGYDDVEFDVNVPWRATVRVTIDPNAGGNLIWLDKIEVTR